MEIYAVSAIYAAGSPNFSTRPGTWRNVKEIAGYGGLGDMGSHIIDMVLWLLRTEVTAVTGVTRTLAPERTDRDTGSSCGSPPRIRACCC